MGMSYLLFEGLPKFFSGDDFILLNASRTENGYASSIVGCANDLGMGKWRPMFVCTITPVLKLFGDRYWCYFLLNLTLIFLICLLAGNLLRKITEIPEWILILFVFALPFSRFAWYGRVSPFGLMEFGALLFALLFARQFFQALERKTHGAWYLAGGLACLSSMFHERYLVLIACGLFVSVLNLRTRPRLIPLTPWLVLASLVIAIRQYLLKTNLLVGGGEAPLASSADTWILEHFFVGLKAVFGLGNGTNISFDPSGYIRQPPLGVFSQLWLVTLFLIVLLLVLLKVVRNRDTPKVTCGINEGPEEKNNVMNQLLLVCGLTLIVPAATVVSRIEGRWLLGPEVLIFIFLMSLFTSPKLHLVFITVFLSFSIACLQFLPRYETPIRLSDEILTLVQRDLDGQSELKYAIVDPRGRPQLVNWLDWTLGREEKFRQIGVQSVRLIDSTNCFDPCIEIEFEDSDDFDLVAKP